MPGRLGIVAGGGALPALLIDACRGIGGDPFLLALEGQATSDDLSHPPDAWIRIGKIGAGIKILRAAGVDTIVFAGRVRRPGLAELRPDGWTARALARVGKRLIGDDGLLSALIGELEREGFSVVAPDSLLGDLVAAEGVYGAVVPDTAARADIDRGLDVLRTIGPLDIGQAVIVQDGHVLGVEAAEGTDALIERCGPLQREGPGGVLVKIAKPGQERRVDLPTIGVHTVRLAAEAGLRGIAVEAGGALVLERDKLVRAADDGGLFVVGLAVST